MIWVTLSMKTTPGSCSTSGDNSEHRNIKNHVIGHGIIVFVQACPVIRNVATVFELLYPAEFQCIHDLWMTDSVNHMKGTRWAMDSCTWGLGSAH